MTWNHSCKCATVHTAVFQRYRKLSTLSQTQVIQQRNQDSRFCSISLMTSGSILSLSKWSRSTLDHFCSESMMIQGRDMSTTNTAKQSDSDLAETANLSRPLWYRSPSRIHTLQRVKSGQDKRKMLFMKTHIHRKTSAVDLTISVFIMDTQVQVLQSPSFLIVFSSFKFGHECCFA